MVDIVGFSSVDGPILHDKKLAIRDLLNAFQTVQGELAWNPLFGSIIPKLLFENMNESVIETIEADVSRIIGKDSRWSLVSINSVTSNGNTVSVNVLISYLGQTAESLELNFNQAIGVG